MTIISLNAHERDLNQAAGRVREVELLQESMTKAREIAAQFPHLRARLDTAATAYAAAPENTFEFGLQALLDGLEARLAAIIAGPRRR